MSNPFDSTTLDIGNELISKMAAENKRRWEDMITSTDLTGNSRNAWQTVRTISNDPTASKPPFLVTANQVAHQLLVKGRAEMPTKPKSPKLSPISEDDSSLVFPFTEEKYKKSIATLNNKMVTLNAKSMLHREPNPQSIEAIENLCNTETGKRLVDTEELHTYIHPMSHV